MLRLAVLVSGGGTNLQAIMDAIDNGAITNAEIDVVISNNKNAFALERAAKHGIEAKAISPKDFETRDAFNEALYEELVSRKIDLIVFVVAEFPHVAAHLRKRTVAAALQCGVGASPVAFQRGV